MSINNFMNVGKEQSFSEIYHAAVNAIKSAAANSGRTNQYNEQMVRLAKGDEGRRPVMKIPSEAGQAYSLMNMYKTTAEAVKAIIRGLSAPSNQYNEQMRNMYYNAVGLKDKRAGSLRLMDTIDKVVGLPVELHPFDGKDIRGYVVSNNGRLTVADRLDRKPDYLSSMFYHRCQQVRLPPAEVRLDTKDFEHYSLLL